MTICRDRLFKAVQATLPDSQKLNRIESKEEVAMAVNVLLNRDKQNSPKRNGK